VLAAEKALFERLAGDEHIPSFEKPPPATNNRSHRWRCCVSKLIGLSVSPRIASVERNSGYWKLIPIAAARILEKRNSLQMSQVFLFP
jgi:hypothetical protein